MPEAITIPAKYIFLDVVRFTHKRSVEAQSDIVHVLNGIVKSAVVSSGIPFDKIIFLPTGDGICIALLNIESPYDVHLHIALNIIKGVQEYSDATEDSMRKFQVRIGLSANTDNLITDINESRNMAGAGINMASRVMSMADGNQILVGETVYDTLRYREKYMSAFRGYEAEVKHHVRIKVYQFIAEGHIGLNINTPEAFLQVSEAKLTKLVAYYFAHAIKNRSFFISKLDHTDAYPSTVLLWFLARDSVSKSEATDINKPFYNTYKRGEATIEEQFNHYYSLGTNVVFPLANLIRATCLWRYEDCFEGVKEYRFIKPEGVTKLKKEWPGISAEFDLDNYV